MAPCRRPSAPSSPAWLRGGRVSMPFGVMVQPEPGAGPRPPPVASARRRARPPERLRPAVPVPAARDCDGRDRGPAEAARRPGARAPWLRIRPNSRVSVPSPSASAPIGLNSLANGQRASYGQNLVGFTIGSTSRALVATAIFTVGEVKSLLAITRNRTATGIGAGLPPGTTARSVAEIDKRDASDLSCSLSVRQLQYGRRWRDRNAAVSQLVGEGISAWKLPEPAMVRSTACPFSTSGCSGELVNWATLTSRASRSRDLISSRGSIRSA